MRLKPLQNYLVENEESEELECLSLHERAIGGQRTEAGAELVAVDKIHLQATAEFVWHSFHLAGVRQPKASESPGINLALGWQEVFASQVQLLAVRDIAN